MSAQNNDQSSNAGAIPVRQVSFTPRRITTATTTLVKTGSGTLGRVIVNTAGAGSSISIYDSLTGSGTLIAVMSTAAQTSLAYEVSFTIGLCVVTAGGTPADVTVTYL